jgi:integrase
MPKPSYPYLQRERNRHGNLTYYVRKGTGPRTRIRGHYGSDEFMTNYQAALSGEPFVNPAVQRETLQTVNWLIQEYRKSADYSGFSKSTKKARDAIFRQMIEKIGSKPATSINTASVIAARDKRAIKTPDQARHFLDTLRGLFKWATSAGKVPVDPTTGVQNPKRNRTKTGFEMWTEKDVAAYEARWPTNSKERVWLNVLMYTGARRGDAVRLGWPLVENDILSFKTEKSGYTVEVNLPVLAPLKTAIEEGHSGKETWICGASGKPLTKESFGNVFREACTEAGIKEKSAHGLRKIAATRAAEAGANAQTLDALFGWTDGQMAAHYTRNADRKKLAVENGKMMLGAKAKAADSSVEKEAA